MILPLHTIYGFRPGGNRSTPVQKPLPLSQGNDDFPLQSLPRAPLLAKFPPNGQRQDLFRNHFQVREGANLHHFFQDRGGAAHVLVTPKASPRVMAVFPSDDSGFALSFRRSSPDAQQPTLELKEAPEADFRKGAPQRISLKIGIESRSFILDPPFLGSVREFRSGKAKAEEERSEFARHMAVPPGWIKPDVRIDRQGAAIHIFRSNLNGEKPYGASIHLPTGTDISRTGDGALEIHIPDQASSELQIEINMDLPPLTPFGARDLLSKDIQTDQTELRALSFLATREKMMAGSWRFLTYFGRDTMLTAGMLKEVLSPEALLVALQSVLDRLSPDGRVAHEEEIGAQAELRHIERFNELYSQGKTVEAFKEIQDPQVPVYDYSMVDDDFLLPLLASQVLGDTRISHETKRAFLEKKTSRGASNLELLVSNANYVLKKATYHGERIEDSEKGLIRIEEGKLFGDWRDSPTGLGGGVFPGGLNITLVHASLGAVKDLFDSGGVPDEILRGSSASQRSSDLRNIGKIKGIMSIWKKAGARFEVHLSPDEMRRRVQDYLDSGVLSAEEVKILLKQKIASGTTVGGFLRDGDTPPCLKDGITFHALSLDRHGRRVEVLNSDAAYELFFGEPTVERLHEILTVLSLPYPLGLFTDVGLLAANPATSNKQDLYRTLDKRAYHGTVIWKWQVSLTELGLIRQIKHFSGDTGAKHLVAHMKTLLSRLRSAEDRVGALGNSELWTFKVRNGATEATAYGSNPGDETESDPVQLWSTVGLAIESQS